MNSHPSYLTTCLTALLLAACGAAVAEPASPSPAAQDTEESQAIAPVGAVAAAGPAAREPEVATEPMPVGSPVELERTGNPVESGDGETQALASATPDNQVSALEPEHDAADDAGAFTEPETAPAPAATIDPVTLYGEWTVREQHPEAGEVVTLFSINSDSSFAGTMTVAGDVVWSYSGNWYLDGNLITWFYTESTPPLMLADETEVDEIILIDSEKLTYRSGTRDVLETLYRAN